MGARIGLIGLGRMGMPICADLARAGYEVAATDKRHELRADALAAGASWSTSPGAAATEADVLVTVLPGASEVREALLGPEGALAGLAAGAAWLDMSTCDPRAGRELAREAQARGVHCIDAPMAGNPIAAADGTLQLFVGGDSSVLEEQRRLLEVVARPAAIRHVGPNGAGYVAKLLVNLLWFGQAVATAEAMLLAAREGLDLGVLREAIGASAASSHFVRSDLDALLAGNYMRSFRLDRCLDELSAVTALASELELPHELASSVEGIYRRALERYGAVDGELLAVALLEEEAGQRLRHAGW
jgi:3-hydroxyisobutyrate dehydrogenase